MEPAYRIVNDTSKEQKKVQRSGWQLVACELLSVAVLILVVLWFCVLPVVGMLYFFGLMK